MDNCNATISGHPVAVDMVNDCWSRALSLLNGLSGDDPETIEKRQMADFKTLEDLRARVDVVVKDPQTANALKPWYNLMCKRSEEHTSELQSLMRISYAVFCLKKKKNIKHEREHE